MTKDGRFIRTQKIILYILPILSIIGIIFPLKLGKLNLALLGSYIVIPMVFAPIMFLIYRKNLKTYFSNSEYLNSNSNKKYYTDSWFLILSILYVFGFSTSIIILDIYDIRPYIYYVIMALVSTFILLEILLFDISYKKITVILLQIMLLTLNLIWSVTLKYYYFIERTDPFVHTWIIYNLLDNGHIVSGVFEYYQSFPLWHIMIASVYMIINLSIPIYKMMFFVNGLDFAFLILVVYFISLKIFKDRKFALISGLFVATNPDIIFFGMASLPRSVVSFFEGLLILSLFYSDDIPKIFLIMFLTLTIIIYHTVSMPFIIIIFLIILLLQKLYKVESKYLTLDYIKLTVISNIVYYLYIAPYIFKIMVKNVDNPGVIGVITKSVVYTPLNELFNYLQYVPLLFFVIIGIISVLETKSRFSGFEKVFCMTGFLLVGVSFPGPSLLFNKLASNLNLLRFAEYALIVILMIGAIGLIGLYYSVGRKTKFVVLILFIIMTFLSISNDWNASDNPLVKRVYYTFYLTEEETVAFSHIANITSGYVMSDYVTYRYLLFSRYESKSNMLEIDTEDRLLKNNSSDNILIRNDELKKRPLRFFVSTTGKFQSDPSIVGPTIDYYFSDSPIWSKLENYNKIYNSGGVSGYN